MYIVNAHNGRVLAASLTQGTDCEIDEGKIVVLKSELLNCGCFLNMFRS